MKIFKKIFICAGVLVSFFSSAGYLEKTHSLTEAVEKETKKRFNDEALQNLYEYRQIVQKNAYADTMRLCSAYRQAVNMGPPAYHEHLSSPYYMNHSSTEVRKWAQNITRQYGEALSSSLQAWMRLAYEGGAQPFSAMFGMKADYIEKTNTGFFEMRSWFQSLYALFLINSLGFTAGASHCLGSLNENEINRFASAIMIFDSEASLAGHALTFWTGGVIINYLIKAVRLPLRSAGQITSSFIQKMKHHFAWNIKIHPAFSKRNILTAGGLSLTGGLGFFIYEKIKQRRVLENQLQSALSLTLADSRKAGGKSNRFALLNKAYRIFSSIEQDSSHSENLSYDSFDRFVYQNFDENVFNLMNQDRQTLAQSANEQENTVIHYRDIFYLHLLENFLTVVEESYRHSLVSFNDGRSRLHLSSKRG